MERLTDEERRIRRRESVRRWAEKNREYNIARQKKYYPARLAKVKEMRKNDPQTFRDKANAYNAENRGRVRELERGRYRKNVKKMSEKAKTWRSENPELAKEIVKDWRRRNKTRHALNLKEWNLISNYGISLEQRDAMLALQGNKCAICSSTTSGWTRDWHVDHCHKTGGIRGILCHPCNMTIGNAKDNPSTLRNAADYLEAHAAKGASHPSQTSTSSAKPLYADDLFSA